MDLDVLTSTLHVFHIRSINVVVNPIFVLCNSRYRRKTTHANLLSRSPVLATDTGQAAVAVLFVSSEFETTVIEARPLLPGKPQS
jgi:hypothetical protein